MNNRNHLIKLIHIGKRELALDDDTYRALLTTNGGHPSCSQMNIKQLEMVLTVMERQGFKRAVKRRLSPKSGKAKHAQIDKVRAIWITMYHQGIVRDRSEAALDTYIFRMTGVNHVGWLDSKQASMVLEALKRWTTRIKGVYLH